jgi:hypothetical protein
MLVIEVEQGGDGGIGAVETHHPAFEAKRRQ